MVDPCRIGDLPERLFAHSLQLIGDDEAEDPSPLFLEAQDAASLLAEIRNAAMCEACDTQAACSTGIAQCYLSGEFLAPAKARGETL